VTAETKGSGQRRVQLRARIGRGLMGSGPCGGYGPRREGLKKTQRVEGADQLCVASIDAAGRVWEL